jgi:hypothetical protein
VSAGRFLLGTDSDRRAGFGGAAPSPPPLQPGDLPLPMPTAVTLGVSLPKERTGTSFLWCLSEALAIRDKPESSMAYNCRSAVALSLTLSLVLRFRQSLLRNDRPLPDLSAVFQPEDRVGDVRSCSTSSKHRRCGPTPARLAGISAAAVNTAGPQLSGNFQLGQFGRLPSCPASDLPAASPVRDGFRGLKDRPRPPYRGRRKVS